MAKKNKSKSGGGKAKSRGKGGNSYLTEPLTERKAIKAAKRVRRLALGPEKQIIKGQERASKMRSKEIKQWFPQYGEAVDAASGQTAEAYRTAGQSIGTDTAGMASYAEALRQRLAGEGAADAKLRGATNDTSGSTLSAEAQLARISSANTLASVIAGQGASQGAYLTDKKRIGGREMVEQLINEGNRRRNLATEKKQLARQGRDIVRDELARLRDSERDYALGLQAAAGEKSSRRTQRKLAKTYGQNKAREQSTSLQNQLTVAQQQAKNERQDDKRADKWRTNPPKGSPDEGGISVRTALAYLRQADKGAYSSEKSAIDYLINRGVSASVARQAVKKARKSGGGSGGPGGVVGGPF